MLLSIRLRALVRVSDRNTRQKSRLRSACFLVEETHKRNLEFHAWFNPYRITMNHTNLNALSDDHPARSHPDWVAAYGKQLYYNPGIPEVRQFITDGIKEVVSRYDIDAVHMDDYFYPYKIAGQEFPDQAEYERYGKAQFASIDDWRRDNVNLACKRNQPNHQTRKTLCQIRNQPVRRLEKCRR